MNEEIRTRAETALKEAEAVTAALLPEPKSEPVAADATDPAIRAEIERRKAEIDLTSTQSIIRFGSAAQAELQAISQEMLSGVRSKDVGPAGDSLRDMVTSLRGFAVDELDPNRKRSWWERLMGSAEPIAGFMARYEEVQGQIDKITGELLTHEHTLLKDIKSLDKLYEKTLDFYDELALYIAAGEAKVAELDAVDIPAKEAEVQAAPEQQGVMEAQELRDLRAARDDLERRVHDLKLTRQVTMQSLPSIRLVQENDKSLVTKINSTLVNTVPLWETQLAQAVTIHRGREAAGAVKEASDLTNELLTKNAENLRQANVEIRTETERGVFDIEAIEKANADLIATIEDSLRIADEGKARRAAAEASLVRMEGELKDTLASARARAGGSGHRRLSEGAAWTRDPRTSRRHGAVRGLAVALLLAALAGCTSRIEPEPRPARPPAPPPAAEAVPGGESLDDFYASIERDLTSSGRMRRDVAPADAPYTVDDLVRDFERIALYDEYVDVGGRFVRAESPALLRRWDRPVRVAVMTGTSASPEDAARDRANVAAFTRRLAQLTGLDMTPGEGSDVNFLVLFMTSNERTAFADQVAAFYPDFAPAVMGALRDTPLDTFCTAYAFSDPGQPVGLFGGDHPDPRRASAADPALLRARGDGAGDGAAERQPGRAAVAVQRQPRVRAPDRARCDPAPDALRSAAAAGHDRRGGPPAAAGDRRGRDGGAARRGAGGLDAVT